MATMANFDMKQMAPMDAKEFNMPLLMVCLLYSL
jgi:hypothetical protein